LKAWSLAFICVKTRWWKWAQGKKFKNNLSEVKPPYQGQVFKVLCIKCNGQGSTIILVVVYVGVMKIYVATMEVFRKKEK
jgi:hypothetical protein